MKREQFYFISVIFEMILIVCLIAFMLVPESTVVAKERSRSELHKISGQIYGVDGRRLRVMYIGTVYQDTSSITSVWKKYQAVINSGRFKIVYIRTTYSPSGYLVSAEIYYKKR